MKVEVIREHLSKAVGVASRIVGVRSTLPILNNVLIKTDKGKLQISATDLEVGFTTWIGAKIEKEGSYTIPAKLFGDYIAAGTGKTILLEQIESTLKVSYEQQEAAIKGLPATEFPVIPQISGEALFSLSPIILKEQLRKVAIAAAVDETRPALGGILFWKDKNVLRLAATDSYRLAEARLSLTEITSKGAGSEKIIIPQRVAQELIRLLEGADERVEAAVSENQAVFKTTNFVLVSRLIEGEFPSYIDIIPSKGITDIALPTAEFLRAVKTAGLFAREIGNHITVLARPKGEVSIEARSPQVGEHTARLPAKVSGEEQEVSFNARFLQDAVASIVSKETHLVFTGKTSAAVFREEGNQDFLHLVMPLRLE